MSSISATAAGFVPIEQSFSVPEKTKELRELFEDVAKKRLELFEALGQIQVTEPNQHLDLFLNNHVKYHCKHLLREFLYWQETPCSGSSFEIEFLEPEHAATKELVSLRARFHRLYIKYTTFLNRFCWVAKQGYPPLAKGEIQTKPLCDPGESNHIVRRNEFNQKPRKKQPLPQRTQRPQTSAFVKPAQTAVAKKRDL